MMGGRRKVCIHICPACPWQFGVFRKFVLQIFLVFFDILGIHTSVGSTTEAPDSDQMFKLADLLEGVSVDCTDLSRAQLPSN